MMTLVSCLLMLLVPQENKKDNKLTPKELILTSFIFDLANFVAFSYIFLK